MSANRRRGHGARRLAGWALALAVFGALVSAAGADQTVVSLVSTGSGGNGPYDSELFLSSQDGAHVVFYTNESLVGNDNDGFHQDVYERSGGVTTLVSTGSVGGDGFFAASPIAVSEDGLRVFFTTRERLVSDDSDNSFDVYERSAGTTTLVSTGSPGGNGSFNVFFAYISRDGSHAVFETQERLVSGDTDSSFDVYDRSGNVTTLVSTGPSGGNGAFEAFPSAVSGDGSHVLFYTNEKLVSADTDSAQDIYDFSAGQAQLVSIGPAGGNGPIDATNYSVGISDDGSHVAFETAESLVSADTDSSVDVYERFGGQATLVSTGPSGGNDAVDANFTGISPDGSHVSFQTSESLVSGDTDGRLDAYDHVAVQTSLVSLGNGAFDAIRTGPLSADGSGVLFRTREPLVAADTDSSQDVYKSSGGQVTLVSGGPGWGDGPFGAQLAALSSDLSHIAFLTSEPLAAADTDGSSDVYEAVAGRFILLTVGPDGGNGPFDAYVGSLSDDGTRFSFATAESLVSGDTDTRRDIYETQVTFSTGGPETVAGAVVSGGTVKTGDLPSADDPIETSVTTPTGGTVVIVESATTGTPPTGYGLFGQQVAITALDATAASPLVFAFRLDQSLLTAGGVDESTVQVFRNGVLVPACDTGATGASPDPCVAQRTAFPTYAEITVRTSQASIWSFGKRDPFAVSGFFQPVENLPAVNSAKAGSAIPVKFGLGGNQGLNVLAAGYPRSVSCNPMDPAEPTVTAGNSPLSYDAATGRYTYVWKTQKAWRGCRQLVVHFVDGSYLRANFSFS